MSISEHALRKIASLSRLNITDAEIQQYQQDLTATLELIGHMEDVNDALATLEPMSHAQGDHLRTRDDAITESNQREAFQALAPETEQGLYLVNQVIE